MKRAQSGVTLVNTMVGLVLSLVVVIGMMGTLKSVIGSVIGSDPAAPNGLVPSARLDGQLASGMLTAQLALQEAGYGISGALAETDFIVVNNATLDTTTASKFTGGAKSVVLAAGTAGTALLWGTNPTLASYQCRGLLWQNGALYLLQASAACSTVSSNWTTLNWTAQTLVAGAVGASVSMNANSGANCWPFGLAASTATGSTVSDQTPAKLQVTLTYSNSTVGTGASGTQNTLSVCLANFQS
jgi:hypothetical protein